MAGVSDSRGPEAPVRMRRLRQAATPGTRALIALVAAFGNVSYLGLPYVEALYGAQMAGPAALAVSIHSTFAVSLGPLLLRRPGAST